MMHAGTVEGQSTSTTECVIHGPKKRGPRREEGDDKLRENEREGVGFPSGVAEEAMKPRPVTVADVPSGVDDFGDEEASL